jgi:D-sedoheptulose 7-phosphate isomerase|tara:strand:+ start:223 stop:783 length:561 start_codon:yes stop_codon:yes gene_type:complete
MKDIIQTELNNHLKTAKLLHNMVDEVAECAKICIDSLKNGGKLLIFGNGGSAADAQHLAAELVGKYKTERKGLPAIALTTDSSSVTSIGNDFGFQNIFSRQVEALANEGDIAIGISTSGNSVNVINALILASKLNCETIGFCGKDPGAMASICNVTLNVPSYETPRIQEIHIVFAHIICHLIDQEF